MEYSCDNKDVKLFTNNDEIYDLVKPHIGIAKHPMMGTADGPESGELFVFDFCAPQLTNHFEYSVEELESLRPEWRDSVIQYMVQTSDPANDSDRHVFFFDCKWFNTWYDPYKQKFLFHSFSGLERLRESTILFCDKSLTFNFKEAIMKLMSPAMDATDARKKLKDTCKRDFDIPAPFEHIDLVDSLCDQIAALSVDVRKWKDRFFHCNDLTPDLSLSDGGLCEDCKESQYKAYYESPYSEALKWRPKCPNSEKQCKYWMSDVFMMED